MIHFLFFVYDTLYADALYTDSLVNCVRKTVQPICHCSLLLPLSTELKRGGLDHRGITADGSDIQNLCLDRPANINKQKVIMFP